MANDLPAPLVPADVDLRDFAFMPLDVARLRDSDLAASESPECCWAAVLLWAASWHQVPAGSIPNDDRWIAKQAGYAHRGKVAREWGAVRNGALRGFVECSDGRLYHPVVVEKVLEAWKGKLKQRHATECARIKKHGQRHGMSLPCPSFEEWVSNGCPWGQALPVPGDKSGTRSQCPEEVSGETPSKGQGQGQGEGQIEATLRSASAAAASEAPPFDLRRELGKLVGQEPVLLAQDHHAIQALIDEGLTWPDVVAGIGEALSKADRQKRFNHWRQFVGWIRTAAKTRMGQGGRPPTGAPQKVSDPNDPTHDMGTGFKFRESSLTKAVEAWKKNPRSWKWNELYDEPDKPGCRVPKHILAAAGIRQEVAHAAE